MDAQTGDNRRGGGTFANNGRAGTSTIPPPIWQHLVSQTSEDGTTKRHPPTPGQMQSTCMRSLSVRQGYEKAVEEQTSKELVKPTQSIPTRGDCIGRPIGLTDSRVDTSNDGKINDKKVQTPHRIRRSILGLFIYVPTEVGGG
jgi:hypothetical protein